MSKRMTPHASEPSVDARRSSAPRGVFYKSRPVKAKYSLGFVIPSFLLSPTGIMGALIVALSASNLLFYKLWQNKADEYANFRAEIVVQQQALRDEADRAKAESDQITADVSVAWSDALAWANSHRPVVRVRGACDPSGLRPVPTPSEGTFVGPVQPGFSAPRDVAVEECEARINGAVFDAAQLMHLQSWVQRQHEVKR